MRIVKRISHYLSVEPRGAYVVLNSNVGPLDEDVNIMIEAGEIDVVVKALQECKKLMEQTKMDPEAAKMLGFLLDAKVALTRLENAGELAEYWGDRESAVGAKENARAYLSSLRDFLANYA